MDPQNQDAQQPPTQLSTPAVPGRPQVMPQTAQQPPPKNNSLILIIGGTGLFLIILLILIVPFTLSHSGNSGANTKSTINPESTTTYSSNAASASNATVAILSWSNASSSTPTCPTILNVTGLGGTRGNCSGFTVNIGENDSYGNSDGACPSLVNIGPGGFYDNYVIGCYPDVTWANTQSLSEYYNVNDNITLVGNQTFSGWYNQTLKGVEANLTNSSFMTVHYMNYTPTSTHGYVQNGNFIFSFTLLNGTRRTWHFPLETYDYYTSVPRYSPIIRFATKSGGTINTYDFRGLVTPYVFSGVVSSLTNGSSAGRFVDQVLNLKNQLTSYSYLFYNTSAYPVQILGTGTGDCKDFGVLMASILEAGNMYAGYNMTVQLEYVDVYNLSDPNTTDHLILYITFANGTSRYLDTTGALYEYEPGVIANVTPVYGWRLPLNCTENGCQEETTCNGAYCDSVGYAVNGAESAYAMCSSEYDTVGADGLCHPECGNLYYCNTGYQCSNNYGYNECVPS